MDAADHSKETAPPLWNGHFIFLVLSFFFIFTNIAFLYLYPLALDAMGSDPFQIGWVMGLFSLATVLSRPFLGRLVTLKGEFPVVSLGMVLSVLASLGYHTVTAFGPLMLLVRMLHGIGFSAFVAGNFSLAAKTFHPARRAQSFGIVGAALMAPVALAPPLGEYLIRPWGFHVIYVAAAAAALLSWAALFMALRASATPGPAGMQRPASYRRLLNNRSFLFLLCSTLIFAHCQATVPNFLALISTHQGVQSGPFFFAAYSTAIFVLLAMGRIVDRYGRRLFLRLAYPLLFTGILFVPWLLHRPSWPFSALLFGTGMGLLFPAHNALAAGHGDQSEKPAIMSLFTAVYDTGFITGAVLSGWMAHQTSLEMLFRATAALGAVGFLIALLLPIKEE